MLPTFKIRYPGQYDGGRKLFLRHLLCFNFSQKPAYDMLVELFQHRWRTELTADGQGYAKFRSFGNHVVEIIKNGHTALGRSRVEKGAGTAESMVEE